MRLTTDPRLPSEALELVRLLRDITSQINAISEGQQYAFHAALTAAPTAGDYAVGDFVLNSAPAELGTAGSKYVVTHWVCVAAGTPGTWVEARALTGN